MLSHALPRAHVGLGLLAFIVSVGALVASTLVQAPFARAQSPKLDVPYVPTSEAVVDKMLELAGVGANDYLIDLGSGDGRIPITAARRHGTRGFGVDIDPQRIKEARANAQEAGVSDKVTFEQRDLFQTSISEATVLTLYLLPDVNLRLRPRILGELRPGTRVVSHDFDMGAWTADKIEKVGFKTVYLWVVPAQVGGKWQLSDARSGAESFTLELDQKYQELSGSATIEGRSVPLRNARVAGERVSFEVPLAGGQVKRYEGRFAGGRIQGEGWSATRGS